MLIKFKRINDLKTDHDLTLNEISDILGITPDNFFDYAAGRSNFPLDKLNLFVNYFETSFDYVTGLSDVKHNYSNKINLEDLPNKLKQVRKENKVTQTEIAEVIGDRQSTYWNYENNISTIPISKLYLLAKFYNVSVDYFVGKTENKNILVKEKEEVK